MSEPLISCQASGERRPVFSRYTCWDWPAAGHRGLGQPLTHLSGLAYPLVPAASPLPSSARDLPPTRHTTTPGQRPSWRGPTAELLGPIRSYRPRPVTPGRRRQSQPRPAARGGPAQPLTTPATRARRLADAQSLPPLCTPAWGYVHRGSIRTPHPPVWSGPVTLVRASTMPNRNRCR